RRGGSAVGSARGVHLGRARETPLPARALTVEAAVEQRPAAPESAAPPEDVVLSVRDLHTYFYTGSRSGAGVVQAVRGVSFDLARAEKLGVVGESGSGKSALALSILSLIESPGRVVSGEVWLNGRDLRRLSDRRLQRVRGKEISLVFQDPMSALDPVKRI